MDTGRKCLSSSRFLPDVFSKRRTIAHFDSEGKIPVPNNLLIISVILGSKTGYILVVGILV